MNDPATPTDKGPMDDDELITTINEYLPNRGFIMHGHPTLGGPVRSWPPSRAINGGTLTGPGGTDHNEWSVGADPEGRGIIVFTTDDTFTIDTGKWMVRGELRALDSIRVIGMPSPA